MRFGGRAILARGTGRPTAPPTATASSKRQARVHTRLSFAGSIRPVPRAANYIRFGACRAGELVAPPMRVEADAIDAQKPPVGADGFPRTRGDGPFWHFTTGTDNEVTVPPFSTLRIDQPCEQGCGHRRNLRVGEIEFGTGGDDPAPGRSP